MKVSGFSIIRNALHYGYPVVEAIQSILPLCDEFIINVGVSDDATLRLIQSIDSPKLVIVEREWDMSLRKGGLLLSVETNKALERCTGDWCFYIQADEVLHEKYFDVIRSAMEQNLGDQNVEGLQFGYQHFYGSYDYVQDNYRNWYIRETRIIRRHPDIISWGDAMGFRHKDGTHIRSKPIPAEIYHYGWVRPPQTMISKTSAFQSLWHSDDEIKKSIPVKEVAYDDLGNLKVFFGTHPAVMQERVATSNWDFDAKLDEQHPDWLRHILIFLQPLTKRLKKLVNK